MATKLGICCFLVHLNSRITNIHQNTKVQDAMLERLDNLQMKLHKVPYLKHMCHVHQ